MIKVAPSILSSDFSNLTEVLTQCQKGGADLIHIDVMDGHFVPNLTIGPVVVKDIRKQTTLPLDVHLMIENPDKFIPEFVKAGADYITVHIETCSDILATIRTIKNYGVKAGITLRPGTPLSSIFDVLNTVELVLVMSVEPGFGGQDFIPDATDRIRELRERVRKIPESRRPEISVDGGIKLHNAKEVILAGADILVAGSGIFDTLDPAETITRFKTLY